MNLVLKISWRNIFRHKGKSLIIGVILFLGALLMTIGGGVISGMDRGIEQNIVNGFLGDTVIISGKEKNDNILFKMYGESIETISNYKDIRKFLKTRDYVKDFLPVGKNVAMVLNEDEGDPGFAMTLGVDFDAYRKFFPDNFTVVEGKYRNTDGKGVLIPVKTREELYNQMNMWLVPENGKLVEENLSEDARENIRDLNIRHTTVYMGMNDTNTTTDIRLPVTGIIRFKALNTIWGHFSIMDIESYRKCLGYFSASATSVKISKKEKGLLAMDDTSLDSMFGKDKFYVGNRGTSNISYIDFKRKKTGEATKNVDVEAGTYNLVLVKLKEGAPLEKSVKKLSAALKKAGLKTRAVTWKKASGFIGSMAVIIKGALFAFVMFLFFVAIIIIVNTLSMAAIERTSEIGMMRAVGARKGFISAMFLGETAFLSGFFGGLGIITGIIVIKIIPLLEITTKNDLLQLLYGGDFFNPHLSAGDIIIAVIQLTLVTIITVIYPVKVAKGITPLDAISRD